MPWFVPILISLALSALTYLLSRKSLELNNARDEALNEFSFSKVRQGLPIPVIFGQVRVGGVYIDLADDMNITAHDEELGKGQSYRTYTHRIYAYLALCMGPAHNLFWVQAGQHTNEFGILSMRNTGGSDYSSQSDPVKGIDHVRFFWGEESQDQAPYDRTEREDDLPYYRGICYAIVYFNMGAGSTPPSTSWELRRYIKPLASLDVTMDDDSETDLALIENEELNFAHVLYYLLTESNYFFGLEAESINEASFVTAGNALKAEGIGGGIKIESGTTDLYRYVEEILAWVGGSLVEKEGVIYFILRRDDDTSDHTITADDIEADSIELKRGSWYKVPTVIAFTWINRERSYESQTVLMHDYAPREMGAPYRLKRFSYGIVSGEDIAREVASRLLKNTTYPYALLSFITEDSTIYKEDVLTVTYTKYGLLAKRFRCVGRQDLGFGAYKISCVEEIQRSALVVEGQDPRGSSGEEEIDTDELEWDLYEGQFRRITPLVRRRDEYAPLMLGVNLRTSDYIGGRNVGFAVFQPRKVGNLKVTITAGSAQRDTTTTIQCDYTCELSWATVTDQAWFAGDLALLIVDSDGTDAEIIYAKTVSDDGTTVTFSNLLRGAELSVPGSNSAPFKGIAHSSGAWIYLLGRWQTENTQVQVDDSWIGTLFSHLATPIYSAGTGVWEDEDNAETIEEAYGGTKAGAARPANIEIEGQGPDNDADASGSTISYRWRRRDKAVGAGVKGAGAGIPSAFDSRRSSRYKIEIWNYNETYYFTTRYVDDPGEGSEWVDWDYTYAMRQEDNVYNSNHVLRIYAYNADGIGSDDYARFFCVV